MRPSYRFGRRENTGERLVSAYDRGQAPAHQKIHLRALWAPSSLAANIPSKIL